MNKHLIHENLNTSFVNLTALVRYLRGLGFVGSVHIEFCSYEADITFTRERQMQAREYDHVVGKISRGENAFRRILSRAKEPCGRINVYQNLSHRNGDLLSKVFIDESIVDRARQTVSGRGDTPARYSSNIGAWFKPSTPDLIPGSEREPELPVRPSGSTKFAARDMPTAREWIELLGITEELLRTIDESLAKADLNFAELFRNACAFAASEHPFLDPRSELFAFQNGRITICEQMPASMLSGGIAAALGRVFERLREQSRFRKVTHFTMHRIRMLKTRREVQYDKFCITEALEKIVHF